MDSRAVIDKVTSFMRYKSFFLLAYTPLIRIDSDAWICTAASVNNGLRLYGLSEFERIVCANHPAVFFSHNKPANSAFSTINQRNEQAPNLGRRKKDPMRIWDGKRQASTEHRRMYRRDKPCCACARPFARRWRAGAYVCAVRSRFTLNHSLVTPCTHISCILSTESNIFLDFTFSKKGSHLNWKNLRETKVGTVQWQNICASETGESARATRYRCEPRVPTESARGQWSLFHSFINSGSLLLLTSFFFRDRRI
jgi:hypothetical protein